MARIFKGFRLHPEQIKQLEKLSQLERRSQANLVEMLIANEYQQRFPEIKKLIEGK